jgi:hypothetical protein
VIGRSAANVVSEVMQWPLEWLQTRGLAVQKGVQIYCRPAPERVETRW